MRKQKNEKMDKRITKEEWNKLDDMEKFRRVENFGNHYDEKSQRGFPISITDLKEMAIRYKTPIPTGFDKKDNPIFEGYE